MYLHGFYQQQQQQKQQQQQQPTHTKLTDSQAAETVAS